MTPAHLRAEDVVLGKRLDGVSFSLKSGECVVLTGPNGSGKSSLVRALLGLEAPESGEISLNGSPVGTWTRRTLAAQVAWLPQRPAVVEPRLAEELVAAGRFRFTESPELSLAHARRVLESVDASHLVGRPTDRISGGELQRVLLATLLAQEAPLLLVDEPANHLDPAQQVAAYRTLGRSWADGHGLLVITHELGLARLLGDPAHIRVLGLDQGRIVVDDRLDSPRLPDALAHLSRVPFRSGHKPGALGIDWEAL